MDDSTKMIYDIVVRTEQKLDQCATKDELAKLDKKLDRHISSTGNIAATQTRLAVRKWQIIAGIVATICTAAGGIVATLFSK